MQWTKTKNSLALASSRTLILTTKTYQLRVLLVETNHYIEEVAIIILLICHSKNQTSPRALAKINNS